MIDIFIIIISLLFSAFFSGMEIAYISSNRLQLEIEKKEQNIRANLLSVFTKNETLYIATMLIGNNIALVIYGIFMGKELEPLIAKLITNEIYILIIQTLISTIIILVTAEFLPKSVFRNNANHALQIFALPVALFILLFYPIAQITITLSNLFVKIFFKLDLTKSTQRVAFGKIDLNNFVEELNEETIKGNTIEKEIKIFQNALDFSNIKIRECMIPRTELQAIEVSKTINELRQKIIKSGYSKILVYQENIDNIIGYIHQSELFNRPKTISQKINPLIIAPETMTAKKLLNKFIQQHKSMALVVDEFGGTAGIVTIEDIMEEIFGEIEDEHDTQSLIEKQLSPNTYLFSGRLEIDYLKDKYNINIPDSEAYETLAGFIVVNIGYIPIEGEKIQINSYDITIKKAQSSRIELLQLTIQKNTQNIEANHS